MSVIPLLQEIFVEGLISDNGLGKSVRLKNIVKTKVQRTLLSTTALT
jgi:hypothetical protein